MTRTTHKIGRRGIVAALLVAPMLVPLTVQAHDGHGIGHVTATATVLKKRGKQLNVVLTLYNAGTEAVAVSAATVEGAEVSGLQAVFTVAPGGLEEQKLKLRFADQIPGIFTMILDFGADGQGPVVVMP